MPFSRSGAPTVTDAKGLKGGARAAPRFCGMGATGRRPATLKPGRKREASTGGGLRPFENSSGLRRPPWNPLHGSRQHVPTRFTDARQLSLNSPGPAAQVGVWDHSWRTPPRTRTRAQS